MQVLSLFTIKFSLIFESDLLILQKSNYENEKKIKFIFLLYDWIGYMLIFYFFYTNRNKHNGA